MRLLDKQFNDIERQNILNSLMDCISRICVSESSLEIVRMLGFANDNLAMLAQSRIMQLEEK